MVSEEQRQSNTMLSGKIALITGGGSGIGRATCQLFAEEGATVIAADVNLQNASDTVKNLPGNNHLALRMDVTKLEDILNAIAEIKETYSSPPTIAVNCAGLLSSGSLLNISEENYYQLMDVNVKGVITVTQIVCKELIAVKKHGSIVNIASRAAFRAPSQLPLYSATKAAVDAFSRSAAKEMAMYNIRINTILPGMTKTPMIEGASQDFIQNVVSKEMRHKPADPKNVAEAILFLASDRSSYVSGSSLVIDGALP